MGIGGPYMRIGLLLQKADSQSRNVEMSRRGVSTLNISNI